MEPDKLEKNFSNMLKQKVLATRVVTKIKLHQALEFRNEDEKDLSDNKTLLTRDLGNVTEKTEITFEYRLKDKEELKKIKGFKMSQLKDIPFQSIIEYTKLDGMKCIRTLTQVQKGTEDSKEAKEGAKLDVLATNVTQQASRLAKKGNLREAQAYSMNQKAYLKKNIAPESKSKMFKNWKSKMNVIYGDIHKQNNEEEMADEFAFNSEMESAPKSRIRSKMEDQFAVRLRRGAQFCDDDFDSEDSDFD
mmetsp:Transcript_9493/g.9253  ORF Transcript_9493/g.9253 Transcript_9493/m.9253 type:complete len:248 (+) Transcript_9493:1993-2736(+)